VLGHGVAEALQLHTCVGQHRPEALDLVKLEYDGQDSSKYVTGRPEQDRVLAFAVKSVRVFR
jgi:hypothetical protein